MVGKTLEELGFTAEIWPRHFSVKEAVFPFVKFPGADTLLGPEMKSTGEVMGIDSDFGRAYAKAQIEAGNSLPSSGTVLVSVRLEDRAGICDGVRELAANGFRVLATPGTAEALRELGVEAETVPKVGQGSPDVVQRIEAGDVDLVINTVGPEPRRRARLGRDPARGAAAQSPLLHDARRSPRRGRRDPRAPARIDRRARAAGHPSGPNELRSVILRMGVSPFEEALAAVLRPLKFAARDDFARLDRVHDLEQAVAEAARAARSRLAIPRDAREALAPRARDFAARARGPRR